MLNLPGVEPERASERTARGVLETVLGIQFVRVPPAASPTVDYRSAAGPPRVAEVKEITSKQFRELRKAVTDFDFAPSTVLTRRWSVVLTAPTTFDLLRPQPSLTEPDQELVADMAKAGLHVLSADERRQEWQREHDAARAARTPRVKNLARDLEPWLKVLEDHGVTSTRSLGLPYETWQARAAIARRADGALCMSHAVSPGGEPGVETHFAYGFKRTGSADAVVDRVEAWFVTDDSNNLLASLASEPSSERHAVLVLDPVVEPETGSAQEQGRDFLPTRPISLPGEVDVLWLILGPTTCRYTATDGWSAHGN